MQAMYVIAIRVNASLNVGTVLFRVLLVNNVMMAIKYRTMDVLNARLMLVTIVLVSLVCVNYFVETVNETQPMKNVMTVIM